MNNPWDKFAEVFGTVKNDSDITAKNADNILIAWPIILDFIKTHGIKNAHLLEYGCGTGSFANKLHQLGFTVTGIDTSEGMIKTANAAFKKVHFSVADASQLASTDKFSIVTSVMTFQFVEDIEKTFKNLTKALTPGGIFIFAVFNPTFVKECLRTNTFFSDFDSFEKPKIGSFSYNSPKIPVFIRTSQEYNKILQKLDFEPLLESYPPFTQEFLKKYPVSNLIHESEYMILGYRKIV